LSFSASYKYLSSRVLLQTLPPLSDLKHQHPASPSKLFCTPLSTSLPRFQGTCRTPAALLKKLGRRQNSLLLWPSESSRSIIYSSAATTDCSLQFRLSFSPT